METTSRIAVRFWGVCGSVPAPLTGSQVEDKVARAIIAMRDHGSFLTRASVDDVKAAMREHLPFALRSTMGGNTTCVEVRCDGKLIILDMGTGLRELGIALLPQILRDKGAHGTILQSHVHWDHIQGYPFWKPLYMPRSVFDNRFDFYGGREWDRSLEDVLRGQMDAPVFPVIHGELEQTAMRMSFNTVFDGRVIALDGPSGPIKITCRKLNHPQETYGYRIEYCGQVVTFCTDHEPYAGGVLPRPLVELARGADIFITDCQYSHDEYAGAGGKVQKLGWGHSYPAYIAAVAKEAQPKRVVTTHHEPETSDEGILALACAVQEECGIPTVAAYEGLELLAA